MSTCVVLQWSFARSAKNQNLQLKINDEWRLSEQTAAALQRLNKDFIKEVFHCWVHKYLDRDTGFTSLPRLFSTVDLNWSNQGVVKQSNSFNMHMFSHRVM